MFGFLRSLHQYIYNQSSFIVMKLGGSNSKASLQSWRVEPSHADSQAQSRSECSCSTAPTSKKKSSPQLVSYGEKHQHGFLQGPRSQRILSRLHQTTTEERRRSFVWGQFTRGIGKLVRVRCLNRRGLHWRLWGCKTARRHDSFELSYITETCAIFRFRRSKG